MADNGDAKYCIQLIVVGTRHEYYGVVKCSVSYNFG